MLIGDFSDSKNLEKFPVSYQFNNVLLLSNKCRLEFLHTFDSNEVYLYLDVVALSSLNYQSNTNLLLYKFLKVLY